jgi:hypothetical protein
MFAVPPSSQCNFNNSHIDFTTSSDTISYKPPDRSTQISAAISSIQSAAAKLSSQSSQYSSTIDESSHSIIFRNVSHEVVPENNSSNPISATHIPALGNKNNNLNNVTVNMTRDNISTTNTSPVFSENVFRYNSKI